MRAAYLDVDMLDFDYRAEHFDKLIHCCKLPHVSDLMQQFDLLWWCRGVGSDHLVVSPLSRHDGEGCASMLRG